MPGVWPEHALPWNTSVDYAAAQTNATIIAAPATDHMQPRRRVITWLVISNGATAGNITLLDGSGGTVLFEIYAAINGGAVLDNIHIPLSATTLLAITSTTVTTHSVTVGGYIEGV